jgi:hypothetical protein
VDPNFTGVFYVCGVGRGILRVVTEMGRAYQTPALLSNVDNMMALWQLWLGDVVGTVGLSCSLSTN